MILGVITIIAMLFLSYVYSYIVFYDYFQFGWKYSKCKFKIRLKVCPNDIANFLNNKPTMKYRPFLSKKIWAYVGGNWDYNGEFDYVYFFSDESDYIAVKMRFE